MAASTKFIEDNVCSICLNEFNVPKRIDCSHSFCCQCLDDYIQQSAKDNQFQCPLCRRDTTIPNGGVNEFPIDIEIKNTLVEKCGDNIPNCDVCKGDVQSKYNCQDCKQNMCDSCKNTHDNFTVTQEHVANLHETMEIKVKVERIDTRTDIVCDYRDVCPKHPQKPVKVHCQDCSVSLCFHCFVSHHNGHQFLDLQNKDVQQQIRADLNILKQEVETQMIKLQTFTDTLSLKISAIRHFSETAGKKVDSQVKKLCDAITAEGEEIKVNIFKTFDEENLKLENLLEKVQVLSDDLKSHIKYSSTVLEDNSIVQVLSLIPEVKRVKEETDSKKHDIPELKFPWFHEPKIDNEILCKQLGKLKNHVNFTFMTSFDLNDLTIKKDCHSEPCVIGGLSWYIKVKKDNVNKTSLAIYLVLKDGDMINSCSADYSFLLHNNDNSKSVERELRHTFSSNTKNWGLSSCIDWEKLTNKDFGFIDEDNMFTIQTTINITNIDRK